MKLLFRIVFLIAMLPASWNVLAQSVSGVSVTDQWIREMPPVASSTAAYMTISNQSGKPLTLVGVQSQDFERVEIHRTVEKDGMASMVKQEQVAIAPGATLTLAPGGYHVMLIGFKRALKAGESVPLTLNFAGGASQTLSVPVRKSMGSGGHHHKHH
jgi:periplasmic copper chaperone A